MVVALPSVQPSYAAGYASPITGGMAHPDLWRNVVGAWCPSLGATGSTLRDLSGNHNHGTLTNFTLADAWADPAGLTFDGTADYVDTGIDYPVINTSTTISAWARTTSSSGLLRIVSNYPGNNPKDFFSLYINNGAILGFARDLSQDTVAPTNSATFNDGELHHAVFVFKPTSGVLYVDGVAGTEATDADFDGNVSSTETIAIGRASGTESSGWWDDLIDSVTIWNRALTANEVATLYRLGPRGMYQRQQLAGWIEQAAPGPLGIPIAAYHYNHNVGSRL